MTLAGALAALAALCWLYVARLGARMPAHAAMAMPDTRAWTGGDFALASLMWSAMMIAMMLPAALPVIFLFDSVARRRRTAGRRAVPTAVFVTGYLLAWIGFSVAAAIAQLLLRDAGLLSSSLATTRPLLGGGILIAAGLYQWSPLKRTCLAHCRSPLGWLSTQWREGTAGALRMGMRHGIHCLGCCWLLMALLFVAGVMNLVWVVALAFLVLIEKVAPRGEAAARVVGAVLVLWGGVVLRG